MSCPVDDFDRQLFGRFIVTGRRQWIGQSGIRVRRDETVTDMRQLLDVLAQFGGTERAIEAEGKRPDVAQRVPEGLGRLAGQRAAGGVGDRSGNHHRPTPTGLLEMLLDREQRGLGVERVEDRFDQQDVRATIAEAADGFTIGINQLIEAGVAIARIIHVWRDRRRARSRAEYPGNETRLRWTVRGEFVAHLSRELCAGEVQLIHNAFELVVGLRNRRGVEGIGFDDVSTGGKILGVNTANDLGPRQQQQVVVALQIVLMIGEARIAKVALFQPVALNHCAHGAIKDENALFEQGFQFGCTVGLHGDYLSCVECQVDVPRNAKNPSAQSSTGFRFVSGHALAAFLTRPQSNEIKSARTR